MALAEAPRRPVLRYHGGKWRMAPWIISQMPEHRLYTEAYGGGASVLLRKPRTYSEVYNDMDTEVVNVFAVLRDPDLSEQLERMLRLTPYARDEFEAAYLTDSEDLVEKARRTIVKAFMGFGSAAIHTPTPRGMRTRASTWRPPTGFRSNAARSGTTPAHDWAHYPDLVSTFCERLQGVVVENRPALEVIRQHDRADALHYVDPPYVASTRDAGPDYCYEMTDADHEVLSELLHGLSGMVILSGYRCDLYDRLYADWRRQEKTAYADGAAKRTECLWFSPNIRAHQMQLG